MKTKLTEQLELALSQAANPEIAGPMSAYMRHQFVFYGIKTPLRNSICKPLVKAYLPASEPALAEQLLHMWNRKEREWKYTAIQVAEASRKLWGYSIIDVFERMLCTESWWDTVDGIASVLVSPWFLKFPEKRYEVLSRWEASNTMWLIRVCIIHQLKYGAGTDTVYLSGIIGRHAGSDEFFIQKAIGWALRQYAKTNPEWVLEFVKEQTLKPLSLREALKNI